MIEVKNLSFKYRNGKHVLEDINLTVNDGEIISIIGNNGAGKSTLLKIVSGILKPTKGSVIVDNLDAYKRCNLKNIRKKIGIVFQNPDSQILFNTVYDEMEFPLINLKMENRNDRIKNALFMVGMEQYINSDTFKLSLGQKQRVNIASSLAVNPKYLLLDEPTTMIDTNGKLQIYEIINKLKSNNQTIVFVTNNINEILFADRIVVLEKGRISKILSKQELLGNMEILEKMDMYIPDFLKLIIILNKKGMNINIENYSVECLANKIIEEMKK